MKKIIAICLVSMLTAAGAVHAGQYVSANVNPGPSPCYSVWIKLIITFHRPKLQCQSGFGICFDIEVGTDKAAGSGSGQCQAQARINAAGQLELMVSEGDLQKYESGFALPYFRSGTLAFEDPYTFSEPVARKLGTLSQVTIKSGSYTVVYDASAHSYLVTFPI
ncbi:MAG: hypothetical protein WCI48_00365 [Bacteroidota bacterium]|jgi:hypothetical protein